MRRQGYTRRGGLLLAMLAVLLPVLLGPVVHAAIMRADPGMAMDGMSMGGTSGDMPMSGMADCREDMGAKPGMPEDPPHHHGPDCAICPLCSALAHPTIAWAPAPTVPAPKLIFISSLETLPEARAPPRLFAAAAQARGPPTQV